VGCWESAFEPRLNFHFVFKSGRSWSNNVLRGSTFNDLTNQFFKSDIVILKYLFWCAHLATFLFFSIIELSRIGWKQDAILAWIWQYFHLALNETRTHDLTTVSWVCLPLDRTFKVNKYVSIWQVWLANCLQYLAYSLEAS